MKIDIKIPETLSEITLNQFQKYNKLIKDNEPSEFVNQKTIEIFCDIKLADVARIRIADVNDILLHLNNLLNTKPKLINTFKLGSIQFGFIPKLEDITSGEFIDLETYLSDVDTFHKAMAVLFRPITNNKKGMYLIEEYKGSDEYAEALKFMPLDVALGAMVFFYHLHNDCVNGLRVYIQSEVENSEDLKKVLEKSGVGINQFTQQLKEIFSNLNLLQDYQ